MEEIKSLLRKNKKDHAREPRNRTVVSLGRRTTFEGVQIENKTQQYEEVMNLRQKL